MKNMLKGYTLLELIIVMSIIAIITLLGVSGFVSYRSYVQLESAYSDFVTGLKLQRNKALNSVSYNHPDSVSLTVDVPDFYAVNMTNSSFKFYYCNKIGSSNYAICKEDLNSKALVLPNTIQFQPQDCEIIAFQRGTGDIYHIDKSAIDTESGVFEDTPSNITCSANITNLSNIFIKSITFDYDNETFK